MKIIRFEQKHSNKTILAAVTEDSKVFTLPYSTLLEVIEEAKSKSITTVELITELIKDSLPIDEKLEELDLLVPIEAPEVWASGVTYQKSKEARNFEATNGKLDATTFYDKVYDAERPEIFLKSTKERTVGPNQDLFLRSDSDWQIPEPELGLVLNGEGEIIGYTVGNDMSCRDIEGENPLYLPQAKVWARSCSIGPAILLSEKVKDPYNFEIICRIYRNEELQFEGTANTGQLKRGFEELAGFLKRDNILFPGTVLLTGTCIVPPNEFTLADNDRIEIEISGIGVLKNVVKTQVAKLAN
ncbi:fumarylacetoacetate hydrolase family protein [Desertibacillus haloalkaliphilus]|uniref:fumarylacetoacetate hydrolase family protein n=1 Tax=Desertibacillus haloalkaliphilus TaxID=1328930 RepID=UPI001C26A031|nr:fumarylacetoacetate hydrolase family protein [Desertibacillus haloalkaliphilus]MBU8908199.1 fumarylacetoacetate hydrolase family protein [Desertibacillus haloalkaliphilus]